MSGSPRASVTSRICWLSAILVSFETVRRWVNLSTPQRVGNRYLWTLLVVGARAALYHPKPRTRCDPGRRSSCRASPSSLSPSHSPIKWRASPSRSCAARQPIAQLRPNDHRHRQRPKAAQEGDHEVMRRKRIDLKARGLVCAVKRANVIAARNQRRPAGRQDPHR
jgi:hypothetical protein